MNKLPRRFLAVSMAALVTTAAGWSVVTAVEAQTPPPAGARAGGPSMPGGKGPEGMRGHHWMREIERLKTSLQLNANQAALWDRATAQMKPPTDQREQMKTRHDRMAAALDDPNFDPRKLAAEMDRAGTEQRARMTSTRDAWFAVYDSLNAAQRGQVREFLREKMTRRHGMGDRMHGWMHHGEEQRDHGPMAPPPAGGPAPTR